MSQNLFPLPIDTPISDDPKWPVKFGAVWNRFLKAIGDDMLAANIVNNAKVTDITSPTTSTVTQVVLNDAAKAFKYTLNANRCEVTYHNVAPLSVPLVINLPYTAALTFDVLGVMYAPTPSAPIKAVTIPPTIGYVRFWYVIQTTRN
jgi:hypothetical protein